MIPFLLFEITSGAVPTIPQLWPPGATDGSGPFSTATQGIWPLYATSGSGPSSTSTQGIWPPGATDGAGPSTTAPTNWPH